MEESAPIKKQLIKASHLHWYHWTVVSASLLLTIFAWQFSSRQVQNKVRDQFERESTRVIAQIIERMQRYEDALWAGVAFHIGSNFDIDYDIWKKYASSIELETKYPGINGIGVIHHIFPHEFDEYLHRERALRPEYHVHPEHQENVRLPISYVEPIEKNLQAVGLDMAHESNRFEAALKARDSGEARITGPIVLVQDSEKTPGFLFYAPMFKDVSHHEKRFFGLVYAPFIVRHLMQGTLHAQSRHVTLKITDDGTEIFSEFVKDVKDYDPSPLFKKKIEVGLYGRVWSFQIWSSRQFKHLSSSNQPTLILIGGIAIDIMLLTFFSIATRANRLALEYAESLTADVQLIKEKLEETSSQVDVKLAAIERKKKELRHVTSITAQREEQMISLKKEINKLSEDLGRNAPYELSPELSDKDFIEK